MERVADYIIRKVNEAGAKHVFLISGRGILYLTDAVARNEINPVCTYHEQGASYAAMAYASASNGISACLISTGCAAANAVTACLCSFQDNLPVIFISGNNPLAENTRYSGVPIRTYGSQEADIISIVKSCTKYSVMIDDKESVVSEIEKALYIAQEGRKGPVWIDVPLDVQNMRIDESEQRHFTIPTKSKDYDNTDEVTEIVANDLNVSKRPVLLIGGGARGCTDIIKEFSEKISIPVAFSPSAADVFGTSNELSMGAVGSIGGSRTGNFVVQNADYILAIGTKLCSQETGMKCAFAREARITVVDIDELEHTKDGVKIDRSINSDAKVFLNALIKKKINKVSLEWVEKCAHWKDIFSIENEAFVRQLEQENELDIYSVAYKLSQNLSDNATIITDAGFEELIIPSTIRYRVGQRCLFPASQGAMGYAIPAIIGAYFAGRKRLICVVGDGSFMMNMQELQKIGSLRIPVSIIVINNNMYAVIRKRQKDLFRNRTIGNDPSDGVETPNFEKIANSFEIGYTKIESRSQFDNSVMEMVCVDGPHIYEVMCTPNQVYLHESYAINEKKKLVHRPIEDMSPFLDREIIKSEMVIPMMEE